MIIGFVAVVFCLMLIDHHIFRGVKALERLEKQLAKDAAREEK